MKTNKPSNKWLDEELEQYFIIAYQAGVKDMGDLPYLTGLTKQAILNKIAEEMAVPERRASNLNDGLRRAAEFMHKNKLLPPGTTTIDGIRSYFLNEPVEQSLEEAVRILSIQLSAAMLVTGKIPDKLHKYESELIAKINKLMVSRAEVVRAVGKPDTEWSPVVLIKKDGSVKTRTDILNDLRTHILETLKLRGE